MNQKKFVSNYINKSELIRNVHKFNPEMSNKQIIDHVLKIFNCKVGQNLVIQSIGNQKVRSGLINSRSVIDGAAKNLLTLCRDDIRVASSHLRGLI